MIRGFRWNIHHRVLMPSILCVSLAVWLSGCHHTRLPTTNDEGGPAGPTPGPLGLTSGTYLLELTGYALSFDPAAKLCRPPGVPTSGTDVVTAAELTLEGEEWVARVSAASEGLELRLRDAGQRGVGGEAVSGVIAGSAADQGLFRPARDLRITIHSSEDPAAAAVVSGTSSAGLFLLGRIEGAISFSDSSGATSTCGAISWTLQRMPGR